MYKKITHNIIEEHYDHPLAMQYKASMENSQEMLVKPMAVESYMENKFKLNIRECINHYISRVRSYLVSYIDGDGADLATIEEQLFKDINYIGQEVVRKYYGVEAATVFEKMLKNISVSLIDTIKVIKAGGDITDLRAGCIRAINELAQFLASANPNNWPADAVNKIIGAAADAWIAQAQYRVKKEWAKDIASVDLTHRIMISGQADDTPGFADVFSSGIIAEFPSKFKKYGESYGNT